MGIVVENVAKKFGDFVALDDVSLNVRDGSLTALLGPSGGGKSTLLRVIAGLEEPDSGQVIIDGEDATAVPARKRGVGFVFQHYAPFKHMTVRDNVAFGLKIRKRSKEEIEERVTELLGLVHLEGFAGRYPSQLSGGQRQRMALARALAVRPKVLLLDEPFGALDATVRKELRAWLRRLHDEMHVTTVFVTHDQEEAMEVAEQIVVLNHGRIEQVGRAAGPLRQAGQRVRHALHRPGDAARAALAAAARPRHPPRAGAGRFRGDGAARAASRVRGARGGQAGDRRRHLGSDHARPRPRSRAARGPAGLAPPGARSCSDARSGRASTARPGAHVSARDQASGASVRRRIRAGMRSLATSASVSSSTTERRLARTAIQTVRRCSAAPV